jgi:hypothetical protein
MTVEGKAMGKNLQLLGVRVHYGHWISKEAFLKVAMSRLEV